MQWPNRSLLISYEYSIIYDIKANVTEKSITKPKYNYIILLVVSRGGWWVSKKVTTQFPKRPTRAHTNTERLILLHIRHVLHSSPQSHLWIEKAIIYGGNSARYHLATIRIIYTIIKANEVSPLHNINPFLLSSWSKKFAFLTTALRRAYLKNL